MMASNLHQASKGKRAVSGLFDKLLKRSLIDKIYPESEDYRNKLRQMLATPTTVYAGFDATSNSLHVGNLVSIISLMHFQRHGHRVICVVGDATTSIGDPSGHSKDREKLDRKTIISNSHSIQSSLKTLFKNHDLYYKPDKSTGAPIMQEPIIVMNSSWYRNKTAVDFVGDVFREVRVGGLLHKKSIQERLKSASGMNMSEFCYQIFQAYDWLELRRRYDCKLQIGGSDQAGNIYTGHDLIKKYTSDTDALGLLSPLIVDSETGKKFGKSTSGTSKGIWLSKHRTSPYGLFQFFHRIPDKEVEKYLKIFTFLDDNQIEDLVYNHLKKPEDVWYCQRKLAEHVCRLIHGEDDLKSAKKITHAFFARSPEEISLLSDEELQELFDETCTFHILHREGLKVLDLIRKANCFKNDLDAERVISAGGLRINGSRVTSFNVPVTSELILANGTTLMRVGKKNYFLFKWTNS